MNEGEKGQTSNWKLPKENSKIVVKNPKKYAGGLPAILSSMKFVHKELGLIRGSQCLKNMNQKKGFDCPGCAWPDPETKRSLTEFCENGVKALAEEATQKSISANFFKQYSIQDLAGQSDYWLGKQGRLSEPVVLKKGSSHYQPISWEEAFQTITKHLLKLSNPDAACFYTSGRTSNEAAFVYQLLVRLYGTNNLPDCSNMCHESSGFAMNDAIGVGKGTVTLNDFKLADCIFVIGQNPGTNHPRMLSALQEAARNSCKIITINPLFEAGSKGFIHPQEISKLLGPISSLSSYFLQVKIGGDIALFKGLMKLLLEKEQLQPGSVLDWDFIHNFTEGFARLKSACSKCSWKDIEKSSGLTKEDLVPIVNAVLASKRIICCWAMGLTQHPHGVGNIQEVLNFLMLRGNLGKPGAGACPVRGHSNVQGDRTMGIWEKPKKEFLSAIERTFSFKPPTHHGLDVVECIKAMNTEKIKVFFAMGGNFLAAAPDTQYTAAGLEKCDLTVHTSTKLNRSHLVTGQTALILPCLVRSERDLQKNRVQLQSVENSMGIVHSTRGSLKPISKFLKSEVRILCELAHHLFKNDPKKNDRIDWLSWANDYSLIRNSIEQVIPGFENFSQKIASQEELVLENPVRDHRIFPTANKKANFRVHPIPIIPRKSGEYVMMSIRTHDQYNTSIYGLDDRYRGIYGGRKVIFINPKDCEEEMLQTGDYVHIESFYNQKMRRVENFKVVSYDIPRKCVATYFPESNPLIPIEHTADQSNTPASKQILVSLKKSLH